MSSLWFLWHFITPDSTFDNLQSIYTCFLFSNKLMFIYRECLKWNRLWHCYWKQPGHQLLQAACMTQQELYINFCSFKDLDVTIKAEHSCGTFRNLCSLREKASKSTHEGCHYVTWSQSPPHGLHCLGCTVLHMLKGVGPFPHTTWACQCMISMSSDHSSEH
jgi:hypothetical protein